jgi:hypothetical protein
MHASIRGETLRRLLLGVAALALTYPFLSPLTIGGTDAKWYAYMLADLLGRMHSGHFPVLVGEGPFAWNGGIHPFRSAPIYMLVAGCWNGLTGGRMTPLMLQHLTVVTSAVVGTLGFYSAATALAPRHRWEAWLAALIYLGTPAWIGLVVCADAYMSYMAFAALPLVLYGNARCVMERGRRGYPALAAGLVLVWMSHPPIAALCTMVTLLIQVGSLAADRSFAWGSAVGGAAWFLALGAWYFQGIAELPPVAGTGTAAHDLIRVAALALALAGLSGWVLLRRGPAWAITAVIGMAVLGATSVPWLVWVGATALLVAAVAGVGRGLGWFDPARKAFETLFACALAGAAVANRVVPVHPGDRSDAALGQVAVNTAQWLDYLRPLHLPLAGLGLTQLGWSVSLGLLAVGFTFFGSRPLVVKLLFAGALAVLISFVRVPGVSDFLVGYFPVGLAGLWSYALSLRLVPVIAAFAAMAGVLWIGLGTAGPSWRRWFIRGVLIAAVAWSAVQGSVFVRWSMGQTGDPKHSSDNLRPENIVLDRFAYDLLKLPGYYSNGVMDPVLESRLHDATGRIAVGPNEIARAMEAAGSSRTRLQVHAVPGSSVWLWVKPGLTVNPGEHLLLRFEFDPKQNYAGYLFLASEHGYREYHLPDSGMGGDTAFGVGPLHTSVISLWNSGTSPETYILSFSREPGNTFGPEGAWFADLIVSRFDPAHAPVRLDGLMPYRATVSAVGPGKLETFRAYLPGYRATVDGRSATVERSTESLVQVAVPAGTHTVEVRYVGTPQRALAAWISGVAWAGFAAFGLGSWWHRRAERVSARCAAGAESAPPIETTAGREGRGVHWGGLTAAALALLFLGEGVAFGRLSLRPTDWMYPRWNDQIQYLTEAYTGYEYTLWHGLLPGLGHTLLKPSAQGVLYDTLAVLGFWFVGPSRGVALALNLLAWVALQAAFYGVTARRLGSRSLAWTGVALLLCWGTPLSAWAGSAIDFRLDFMAACAFGLALAAVINTDGFRSRGRSAIAGAAIGLTVLLRFLTGTYFLLVVAGLLVWLLAGRGRWRRAGNLLLATLIAAALAAPEFWMNRQWVWNYYVIGHFTGPESAIRNPHLGVGRSLDFVVGGLLHDHLGWTFGCAALGLTAAYGAVGWWGRRTERTTPPKTGAERRGEPAPRGVEAVALASWMIPSALFTGMPLVVLTLHSQKSPIVLSILVPGVVALLLGFWAWLSRTREARSGGGGRKWTGIALASVAVVWAAAQFVAVQARRVPDAELQRDARTVNRLADLIYTTSAKAALATPRIAVDRITDALDGQVLRVICYERHRVWVPFIMMLPTGIMREREEVIMNHLQQSDYVFHDEGPTSAGGFPYDQEMRELRPMTEAWCNDRLRLVERFSLQGRPWALYARADLVPTGPLP